MQPRMAIALGLGLLALAARKPATGFQYPPSIDGGKNLVPIPNMPTAAYRSDLPQAIHVYADDFPLTVGDRGNLPLLVGRLLHHRGIAADQVGEITPLTMAALQAYGYATTDLYAGPLTNVLHTEGLTRLASEHPALVGGIVVHPFKPAEG